ncbi:MAG TPA: rhodanese-like domain-containing protein [bacterium]|nr:rhodanese-like domain-containing protein [bacterium]
MANVSVSEVRAEVGQDRAVLVDVRESDEVAAAAIPGALHIPLGELSRRCGEIPKGKQVYFICRSGTRSGLACEQAAAQWPTAASVQGGIVAWEKEGGAVEVRSRVIPLMRQVQIAAGSLILLGFFVGPVWFLIPLVGAGLIFAGVSGFCGMAKLLQFMPWNRHAKTGGAACPN